MQEPKALEHLLYVPPWSPPWSLPNSFLFLSLKTCLKGQRISSPEEVTIKASKAMTGIKKGFRECFEERLEIWQKCGKYYVYRCTLTYFCVINRFRELIESVIENGH